MNADFNDKSLPFEYTPDGGATYTRIGDALGSARPVGFLCKDGAYLCRKCTSGETEVCENTLSADPWNDQWTLIGIAFDPPKSEACAHCYGALN